MAEDSAAPGSSILLLLNLSGPRAAVPNAKKLDDDVRRKRVKLSFESLLTSGQRLGAFCLGLGTCNAFVVVVVAVFLIHLFAQLLRAEAAEERGLEVWRKKKFPDQIEFFKLILQKEKKIKKSTFDFALSRDQAMIVP